MLVYAHMYKYLQHFYKQYMRIFCVFVCSGSCMFKICIKFHNALNLIKEEAL